MQFREASVDDPAAHELLTEYFDARAHGFPAGPFAYLRSFPQAEYFTPPAGVFLVVELDDSDIGCGGIRRIEADRPGQLRYEVKHLWIQRGHQGSGLGRALLAELERRAIGFGATELVLDTNASQAAAAGLYRSNGYVNIEAYNDNPNATDWFWKAI